jgi:hypothetical protein
VAPRTPRSRSRCRAGSTRTTSPSAARVEAPRGIALRDLSDPPGSTYASQSLPAWLRGPRLQTAAKSSRTTPRAGDILPAWRSFAWPGRSSARCAARLPARPCRGPDPARRALRGRILRRSADVSGLAKDREDALGEILAQRGDPAQASLRSARVPRPPAGARALMVGARAAPTHRDAAANTSVLACSRAAGASTGSPGGDRGRPQAVTCSRVSTPSATAVGARRRGHVGVALTAVGGAGVDAENERAVAPQRVGREAAGTATDPDGGRHDDRARASAG